MGKLTLEERFMHTLRAMATASPTGRVSNSALQDKLGWKLEGRYSTIRTNLLKQGRIRTYPGGGGGTLDAGDAPPVDSLPQPLKAFVSYCHADAGLKNELVKHLEPLRRLKLVENWSDGDISAGQEWEKEIVSRLRTSDIIILLITVDFINSEYCYDKELAAAVERHNTKRARIIPVIGRNCFWQNLPFGKIQAALKGQAVMSLPNRDDALTDVAREVKAVAEEVRAARVLPA